MNQFLFLAVALLTIGALPSSIFGADLQPFPYDIVVSGLNITHVSYGSDQSWPCFIVIELIEGTPTYFASNNLKKCEIAENYKECNKVHFPLTVYIRYQGKYGIVEAIDVNLSEAPQFKPCPFETL